VWAFSLTHSAQCASLGAVSTRADVRWWLTEDQTEAWRKLLTRIQNVRSEGEWRREFFYKWAELYGIDLRQQKVPMVRDEQKLTFNHAKKYIDVWVAQHVRTRVLPMVVTKGGDPGLQKKGDGLNLFLAAEFDTHGVFDLDPLWTRDAAVFGNGIAYVDDIDGELVVERVIPTAIDIDEFEWRSGDGRSIFWSTPVDRGMAKALWPEHEVAIDSAPDAIREDNDADGTLLNRDLIMVRRAWHLPSKKGAKDGRYACIIEGATLEWMDYEDEAFPFAILPRIKPVVGFWGDSMMADLAPGQTELDDMTQRVQEAIQLGGVPRLAVRKGSKLNVQKINDQVWTIWECDNPQADVVALNFQCISPDVRQHMVDVESQMGVVSGVSPMAAQSEKPAAITAARALQLMDDVESERKIVSQRNRENFYVQIAKRMIRVCSRLPSYKVLAKTGSQAIEVSFDDVRIPDRDYVFSVTPSNFFAKTPPAIMQQASDMKDLGVMTPQEYFARQGVPDLAQSTALMNAQPDAIAKRLEKMRDEGVSQPPHALMDLNLARKMAGDYYCKAEVDGVAPDRLELIREFAVACQKLQEEMAPAPAQPPPMMPDITNGAPPPPPTPMVS
jgi:hypothetical protein